MPKITIYNPRGELEVEGDAEPGMNLLEASVALGAKHGSACGGVCSCSTCHVWVKKGFDSLDDQEDAEADILDRAFDVKPYSRLGCQAHLAGADVVYQITEESERTWYDEHPKERHEAEAKGLWPPPSGSGSPPKKAP